MFKEIAFTDVKENVVDLLKNQWALVTAGDKDGFNPMTVSWGAVGELWAQDMATIYIRPQRYTVKYLDEKAPYFKEAKLVLVCRKVAKGEFKPEQFIDKSIIPAQYPQNDFHYIYYGAIEKVLINE